MNDSPSQTAVGSPSKTMSFMAHPVTDTVIDVDEFDPTRPKLIEAVVVRVRGDCGNTPYVAPFAIRPTLISPETTLMLAGWAVIVVP